LSQADDLENGHTRADASRALALMTRQARKLLTEAAGYDSGDRDFTRRDHPLAEVNVRVNLRLFRRFLV